MSAVASPRYRIESKDGVHTRVIDVATDEDLSHLFRAIAITCTPDKIVVKLVLVDAAVTLDIAALKARWESTYRGDATPASVPYRGDSPCSAKSPWSLKSPISS